MALFNKYNTGLCSLEINSSGIAFAYAKNPTKPEVTVCEFLPFEDQSQRDDSQLNNNQIKTLLTNIVSKHNLRLAQCIWMLHPNYYHLTLINTPNVPQTEYKQAVRWQVKDIINYPLEDAAVDVFYPNENEISLKKIYVVTAQNSFLQNIVNIIQDCDLAPVAIDIREFAIRNLISGLAATQDDTIGMLSLVDDSCLLVSVKSGQIQFVRRIPVGLKSLINNNYSDLITELQRSFSYCQLELKQEIPSALFIPPLKLDIDHNNIAQNISNNLNKKTSVINLQTIVTCKTSMDQQLESQCWAAIGGLLRNTIK